MTRPLRTLCLALLVSTACAAGAPAALAQAPCGGWTMRTVAEGLGSLENIEPDGRGGLLVSASSQRAIVRLTPDGKSGVLVADVNAPGGLRVRGATLFFNTGDTAQAGAANQGDGTIETFDLDTRARAVWVRGLTMPNGLAFLPNGDAVVSRDVGGEKTGITRVPAEDPSRPQARWAALDDSNGLAVDPTGTWLYAVETFTFESRVYRILIADPRRIEVVKALGGAGVPKGLDDMTVDPAGILYITANGSGEVLRLDPATGAACVVASGLQNPSAVKFGAGPGWPSDRLYVSGFDGRVREIAPAGAPPAGGSPPATGGDGPASSQRRLRIRLSATPRRARAGRRTCIGFRALAGGRAVSGARVRIGRRQALTNSRGRARICAHLRLRVYRPAARKRGLQPGRSLVRALRR